MRKRLCCVFLCCILLALLPLQAMAFSTEHADTSHPNAADRAVATYVTSTTPKAVISLPLVTPVPLAAVIESGIIGTSGGASGAPWRLYDDGRLVVDAGTINFPTGPANSPLIAHNALIYEIIFSEPIIAGPSLAGLFLNLSNVHTITGLDYIDTSAVTSMARMFEGTPSLVNIDDLSGWNTGNVTTMSRMFFGASSLTSLDVSDWDTENVTNMYCMFLNASSLTILDLSAWETGNVTTMGRMFEGASSLTTIGNVTNWNTGNVWHMGNLFWNASSFTTLDLSGWDTGNVTVMSSMFRNTSSLIELNVLGWNTENVTGMSNMFLNASALTRLDLSSWNTISVTSTGMTTMFTAATSLRELTLGTGWHTANTPGLPNPQSASPYTGFWTNIGNGNIYVPEGNYTRSSAELMNNNLTPPAIRENTWIWERQYPLLVVTFESAGNGTVTPNLTGTEPNATIGPTLAIYTQAVPGYKFLHWTSDDPAHIDVPFKTSELHNLIISQNTMFRAYFTPLPPDTHLVTFILNGGYVGGYPDPIITIVYDGDTITETNMPIPTRPNYNFLGWRENNVGALLSQTYVSTLNITESRSFTAYFAYIPPNAHLVTLILDGGYVDGYPDNILIIVYDGDVITEANVPIPTRPNHSFLGWRENNVGSLLSLTDVGALEITASHSFTAQWYRENQTGGVPWSPGPSPGAIPSPSPDLDPSQDSDDELPERQAYLIGTDDGLILPNANITRAEVATIFFRLITDEVREVYWMQENPFSDVELQNWFNNAVSTMTNVGIFKGLSDGTFAPNQPVTRGEMATVIVRVMGETAGIDLSESHFNDIAGHWAKEYINIAALNGWVQGPNGVNGAFYPDRHLTRAEATAMINRISGRLVERAEDLLSNMRTWPDNANINAWYYFYIQSATNSYTFQWRGYGNAFELWVTIIPAPDWSVLERPNSRSGDILQSCLGQGDGLGQVGTGGRFWCPISRKIMQVIKTSLKWDTRTVPLSQTKTYTI